MIDQSHGTGERIADRLRGRQMLVTGSTGLLAKVFTEKLLRCVPEIGGIHLLVRRRRSDRLSSEQRVEREVLGSTVFDRLRALIGPRFESLCREKIHVVNGDLTKEHFGLADNEYEALAGRIDTVVNSAATVTFDERLDIARSLNALGPSRLMRFARDCGNVPFMQVSTCYVSGRKTGDIPEELHGSLQGASVDFDAVIEEMKRECDRIMEESGSGGESERKNLIAAGMDFSHRYDRNDTYTFTKWLGEQLVDRDRGDVPVVILRPAIIESSLEEPVPGWIDGLRMADPMIIAYGRGNLTDFPGKPDVPIDVIPVDLVSNAMIAALEAPGTSPGLKVYQVGSSAGNTMLVSEFVRYLEEGFQRRPMLDDNGRPIRVGSFGIVDLESYHHKCDRQLARAVRYREWLTRWNVSPQKRRRISSTIVRIEQLKYFASIYSPYTHLDCRFLDGRLRALADSLHPEDRKAFPFDVAAIDWREYVVNRHVPGLRKFVLASAREGQQPIPMPRDAVPDDAGVQLSIQKATTIFDAFQHTAKLCGEKVALQMGRGRRWVRYTFQDALSATASIARRFDEFGLAPGDRVAICGENGPSWALTYLAAMRAGLTAVPLDPQLPAEEILGCGRFAGVKLVCAGKSVVDAIRAASEATAGETNSPSIVEMAEPFIPPPGASRDESRPSPLVRGDHVASILFTSGTTVAPKGVQLTHTNLLSNARAIAKAQPLGPRDNFLSVLPLHHALEFTGGFLLPLTSGVTITYVERLKGPEIIQAMRLTKTTVMLVVPKLLKLFLDGIERQVAESGLSVRAAFKMLGLVSDVSRRQLAKRAFGKVHRQFGGHLRLFVCGGSALDPELHSAFGRLGFIVSEGYGLTETSPVLTVNPPDGGKPGSVGKALSGVELDIRDPNRDGIGELWARGPNVMTGYLDNEAATSAVMRDGWFRTGDLCRFDSDGYLYVVGRVTDTIVTDAGKNVYPDEVEVRYKDLPNVKELCVLGMPNATGMGESVHAVIVPNPSSAPDFDPSTLQRTIRETIASVGETVPSHQRIQAVHFWEQELPKTSTLKAKRAEIRARLLEGGGADGRTGRGRVASVEQAPAKADELTDAQRFIYELLARVTQQPISTIQPESNLLLDLGIDSLMKLQLIHELESGFGLRCPDETMTAMSTVRSILTWVGNRRLANERPGAGKSWHAMLHRSNTADLNGGQMPNGRTIAPLRWAARGSLSLFFNSYVRIRAEGVRHIPAEGPFILAANHASHLDSASVLTAVGGRRRVWVAAAADYFFDTRLKSWVFERLFDAIPFDRHAEGIVGLRRCIEILKRSEGLLVMPEGTRSTTGRIQSFKIGVAVMAIEAKAPVIPVRIDNAYELLPKGNVLVRPGVVRVAFGPPVTVEGYRAVEDIEEQYKMYREMTALVQDRVEAMGDGRESET